ncbi:hypothetical protein ABZ611_30900 [Streptomyces sp. NPDC007861]|uniref:hypothetical protein n=1 Tax=Streptomyces sp. NPDC007861 TaxID=3154893 RepID=UPI0033CC01C2
MSENKPGVNLYSRWDPGVGVGDYTIHVEQTVTTTPQWSFKPSFDRKFKVGAPYYNLAEDTVLGCFPPPGASGDFGLLLPYVSFRDAQLPWERKLGEADAMRTAPWLALLVLADGELTPEDVHTGPAGDLLKDSPTGVIMPVPPSEEMAQDTACTVADLSVELFTGLMPPEAQDLALLAHVREAVDEPLPDTTGVRLRSACSQVVSSRFPRVPQTSADGTCHYTAHVVSLAGHQASLTDLSRLDTSKKIRLISLYSWSFSSVASDERGYAEAFDAMTKDATSSGGHVRISTRSNEPAVEQRLKSGYVPVPYSVLTGEQTTAWYRGPLAPAPFRQPPPARAPYTSADEALIYLPMHGMFDISLATAWTLGSQLVQTRRDLAENMLMWKATAARFTAALALATHPDTEGRTLNVLPDSDNGRDLDAELCGRLGDPTRLRSDFHAAMLDGLGERLTAAMQAPLPTVGEREEGEGEHEEGEAVRPSTPSTVLPQAPVSMHEHALALLSDEGTRQVLRTALATEFASKPAAAPLPPHPQAYPVSEEESLGPEDEIRVWEPAKMLALVPSWYLLPLADAVLPEDSIRLFHIDLHWLSAFADGMLSVGTHTELDAAHNPDLKKVLFKTYDTNPPIACGLVMRSRILRHWPQGPFTTQENELIFTIEGAKLVSRQELGPDAALLLFDEVPTSITLREPAHVLQFGITQGAPTDSPSIRLRDANGAVTNNSVTVDASLCRPAVSGHDVEVLDIAKVAECLKTPLKLATVGAEHLAFQLLHPAAVLTVKTSREGAEA